jgi:hypothetical protein
MTLDEFEVGKAWLEQFPFIEREIGRQLLRSLRLVSHTQFETGVSNSLIHLFAQLNDKNVALFSVVETPTEEDVEWPPKRMAGSSADRVKAMNENLARVYGPRVQAHPTLHSMRAERMKNIVLVEDFIGTGRRIATYLRNVMEPTLKSWISYKWTKLWIVSYGGLETGVRALLHIRIRPDGGAFPAGDACTETRAILHAAHAGFLQSICEADATRAHALGDRQRCGRDDLRA